MKKGYTLTLVLGIILIISLVVVSTQKIFFSTSVDNSDYATYENIISEDQNKIKEQLYGNNNYQNGYSIDDNTRITIFDDGKQVIERLKYGIKPNYNGSGQILNYGITSTYVINGANEVSFTDTAFNNANGDGLNYCILNNNPPSLIDTCLLMN